MKTFREWVDSPELQEFKTQLKDMSNQQIKQVYKLVGDPHDLSRFVMFTEARSLLPLSTHISAYVILMDKEIKERKGKGEWG